MKLKPFRGRVLESLLIVVAVGVAVAAVTVVTTPNCCEIAAATCTSAAARFSSALARS